MNKMIKDIVKRLKPSATLQINEETKRLQDQGKKVYKFSTFFFTETSPYIYMFRIFIVKFQLLWPRIDR